MDEYYCFYVGNLGLTIYIWHFNIFHVFLLHYSAQVQVQEKHKQLIQRFGHGAAAVTVNSDSVEVILFGGNRKFRGSKIADPVVLRFGECIRVLGKQAIRLSVDDIHVAAEIL